MEEAFIAHLLATAGVTALVGTRVYFSMAPQDAAAPRVVVHRISGLPVYHTSGQSDLCDTRLQVDCWATTALSAIQIARAVKATCLASFTQDAIEFSSITQLSERTSFSGEGPTARLHRVSLDFRVWHSEP